MVKGNLSTFCKIFSSIHLQKFPLSSTKQLPSLRVLRGEVGEVLSAYSSITSWSHEKLNLSQTFSWHITDHKHWSDSLGKPQTLILMCPNCNITRLLIDRRVILVIQRSIVSTLIHAQGTSSFTPECAQQVILFETTAYNIRSLFIHSY